jgi:hypothetical protein
MSRYTHPPRSFAFAVTVQEIRILGDGALCKQDASAGREKAEDKKSLEATGNGKERQALAHGPLLAGCVV